MRFPFQGAAPRTARRLPQRAPLPKMKTVEAGAEYAFARMGGDFYDFVELGSSRLAFALFDFAGKRDKAMEIAAAVQDVFRAQVSLLFAADHGNDNEALAELALLVNRSILAAAGGVHHSPAFIGCLNELVGTMAYCNAGHTPGLLRHNSEVDTLPANALPLGLFSHATYEPQVKVLQAGASLLLVSRGLVESKFRGEEFGLERLRQIMLGLAPTDAPALCRGVLDSVEEFTRAPLMHNDVTAIALVRK
ncbi:MAG TPA: PP2C family protein-serine/threonine phosphatase [Terriglobales bacterium]|nr:PP2C family protein-serine/threonine phosphatase [Terriglobales bacterium]